MVTPMPSGATSAASDSEMPSNGELGGVVGAGGAERGQPTEGGDVDDVAFAAGAHAGQHRAGEVDQAEHVGVEQRPHLVVLALLDGGKVADVGGAARGARVLVQVFVLEARRDGTSRSVAARLPSRLSATSDGLPGSAW
jgi:hypothetical protein